MALPEIIEKKTSSFGGVLARRRDGGEGEDGSAGLTVFTDCQGNVFCVWNIVSKPVL